MSNGTDPRKDPKSMEDVLASIRRIVHADDEPAGATRRDAPPGRGADESADGDAPLMLTPDMRIDGGAGAESVAGPAGRTAAMPDREALRALVREILAEEFTDGAAESVVRDIIHDELMNGEIGGHVSQNVAHLVRSEIAKALENR